MPVYFLFKSPVVSWAPFWHVKYKIISSLTFSLSIFANQERRSGIHVSKLLQNAVIFYLMWFKLQRCHTWLMISGLLWQEDNCMVWDHGQGVSNRFSMDSVTFLISVSYRKGPHLSERLGFSCGWIWFPDSQDTKSVAFMSHSSFPSDLLWFTATIHLSKWIPKQHREDHPSLGPGDCHVHVMRLVPSWHLVSLESTFEKKNDRWAS